MKDKVIVEREHLTEEEITNNLFNDKLENLGNRGVLNKTQKHVLKSLYGYRCLLIKQIEENDNEIDYLLNLKDKIDIELNKYHLVPSASKVNRKTIRQNKRID